MTESADEPTAEREQIQKIFEHYMPPQVFQELLRQGPESTGISGDRRELTIMFADIRGFTGISERLQPEQVVELLNGYLAAATDVVFEHQGTVDKFIGDAIMALFGAPVPIENHALQAVRGRDGDAAAVRGDPGAPGPARELRHRDQHRAGRRGHDRRAATDELHRDRRRGERRGAGSRARRGPARC